MKELDQPILAFATIQQHLLDSEDQNLVDNVIAHFILESFNYMLGP